MFRNSQREKRGKTKTEIEVQKKILLLRCLTERILVNAHLTDSHFKYRIKMETFELYNFFKEMAQPEHIKIIVTAVFVLVIYPIFRLVAYKLVNKAAKLNLYAESRTRMIKKTLNALIIFIIITILISLWGVETKNIIVALSSVFAVIGVAFFAQWSILSNITAGIVVYFSLNLKIGDRIKILDKDYPIEGTISDIKAFYVFLETDRGENIIYPNSLILQKGISVIKKG
jgi:small-conductance mechanosensitive channel